MFDKIYIINISEDTIRRNSISAELESIGWNSFEFIDAVKGSDLTDGLMWFCDKCNHKLHEYRFPLNDIEHDFISRFRSFYASKELRTCDQCGFELEVDERFI